MWLKKYVIAGLILIVSMNYKFFCISGLHCPEAFKLLLVLKKAVVNMWLSGTTEVSWDIKHHHVQHFYFIFTDFGDKLGRLVSFKIQSSLDHLWRSSHWAKWLRIINVCWSKSFFFFQGNQGDDNFWVVLQKYWSDAIDSLSHMTMATTGQR